MSRAPDANGGIGVFVQHECKQIAAVPRGARQERGSHCPARPSPVHKTYARMFRKKNILRIAIGNRNGLLLISKNLSC